MIAFASSLDQAGPICKSAEDAALMLNAMAGLDAKDSTCADVPVEDYTADLNNSLQGLRIGIPGNTSPRACLLKLSRQCEKRLASMKSLALN